MFRVSVPGIRELVWIGEIARNRFGISSWVWLHSCAWNNRSCLFSRSAIVARVKRINRLSYSWLWRRGRPSLIFSWRNFDIVTGWRTLKIWIQDIINAHLSRYSLWKELNITFCCPTNLWMIYFSSIFLHFCQVCNRQTYTNVKDKFKIDEEDEVLFSKVKK